MEPELLSPFQNETEFEAVNASDEDEINLANQYVPDPKELAYPYVASETEFENVLSPEDAGESPTHHLQNELLEQEWQQLEPFEPEQGFQTNRSEEAYFAEEEIIPDNLLFSPEKNNRATQQNKQQVQKSGLSVQDILSAIGKTISLNNVRETLTAHNQNNPSNPYSIGNSGQPDAVFTEAVHQFQLANFIDPREHDGVVGRATLETLNLFDHKLKSPLNSSGFYGQQVLNKYKSEVATATNNEFTAKNWFGHIVKPAWLGVKITDGIHELLLRKLHEAQDWLLTQPQYKGLTPAALGKALGFTATTRYSCARLSANNQAMHGFGLAIDINVPGNPWIGAGWVLYGEKLKERTHLIDTIRKASGEKLPGNTVFAYLHSIAENFGSDTYAAYDVLQKRNQQFIGYLKANAAELRYWRQSATFDNRNPLNGFLNHHKDLVYALRQMAGLAWGAIDFGPRASGDVMHFDLRTLGVGKIICQKIGGYVPEKGHHPAISSEMDTNELEAEDWNQQEEPEYSEEFELHEALEDPAMEIISQEAEA